MDDLRINSIFLVVGDRGAGKTDFLKDHLDNSPHIKKVILDTFDNPVWRTMKTWRNPEFINRPIPIMNVEDMQRHKNGLYRCFVTDDATLQKALEIYCMNSLVIIEDASRYFEPVLTKSQRSYLLNSKQKNVDLIIVFHFLTDIPPRLVKMANYITLFKTNEYFYDRKRFFYPGFADAFNYVSKSKDKHCNITLQLS